jgi:lambda family phage portal protein
MGAFDKMKVDPSPGAAIAPLKANAGFQDGTDGKGPRLAWARYQSPLGMGWNASANTPLAIQYGGRTARDAVAASVVANDLATSNPALATILDTSEVNAVGTGLTLSSKPDADALGISPEAARKLSHAIETRWKPWSENPLEVDISGRCDIHALAAAAYRSALLNGEIVATLDWQAFRGASTRTKVALLDTRQLDATIIGLRDGWNVLNGVAFDARGRVAGYYLRELPLGATFIQPMAKFVPAFTAWGRRKVIHLFELRDPRQVRGLSPLVGALTPAQEREANAEFTLANAMIQTGFAMTVESDLPPAAAMGGLSVNDEMSGIGAINEYRSDWYTKTRVNPQPGTINHLAPGDKLKFNKVENPTATFEAFDRSLARKAARAAGESYENVSGDYSQTNFSASRMAGEQPHRMTMKRRRNLVEALYRAVFDAWLEEQIETGAIELPDGAPPFYAARDAYTASKWLGLGRAEPDRKKAADATVLELENGLTTFEDALAERGLDLETHIQNLKTERDLLKAAGLDHPFHPGATVTQMRDETLENAPAQMPKKGPRQ